VDVDARAEGGVDCGVEVGGEEDYAFEVFEFAEEDCVVGLVGCGRAPELKGNLLETSSLRAMSPGSRWAMKTSAS
jgi:hypothetical protein